MSFAGSPLGGAERAGGERLLRIPHSDLSLRAPAAWRYYTVGPGASDEILLGFLSTAPLRRACISEKAAGGTIQTCRRPLRRLRPHGLIVEMAMEASPSYWDGLRGGKELHISGHQARIAQEMVHGRKLPWYCPVNTTQVMDAVLELHPHNHGVINACLRSPGLSALDAQMRRVLLSVHSTFH